MRRTESVALAAAGVISGRTSASGRLYVFQSRRLIRSPGRLRAEGCGWGTDGQHGPWNARHGGGHGAAARRHREQQQVSTWCTGRCWRAAGGARRGGEAAGGRRRLQVCRRRRRSACAECEMRRRASGGPAAEDHGARPKYKGRLARAVRIVCFACVPPRRPSAKWQSDVQVRISIAAPLRSLLANLRIARLIKLHARQPGEARHPGPCES